MKVLIIRLSSMGDVVQTLPAIEDAARSIPGIRFDWAVDGSFADIPAWHPSVETVIAPNMRQWRSNAAEALKNKGLSALIKQLRAVKYDRIVDLQGEMKSATLARLASGPRIGYDSRSVREWGTQVAYQRRIRVPKGRHSITRMRELLARALEYPVPTTPVEYGVDPGRLPDVPISLPERFVMLVHATSWASKNWHLERWQEFARLASDAGFVPLLAWGNASERERARVIAGQTGLVLPEMPIAQKAAVIIRAAAVVGLDTGLSHIAAAFGVPGVSMYGATDPLLVGATGMNQLNLATTFECRFCHQRKCTYSVDPEQKPACLTLFDPADVWSRVDQVMDQQTAGALAVV